MGTDRYTEFSGPCACGSGADNIDHCSPDHGWPVSISVWYETSVNCSVCSKTYTILEREDAFYRVSFSELQLKEACVQEVVAASKVLVQQAQESGLLANLEKLIDSQKSGAAKHQLLRAAGLEHRSIATFRKQWSTAQEWIVRNVSGRDIEKIMAPVGNNDAVLKASAEALRNQSIEAYENSATMGDAIYKLK